MRINNCMYNELMEGDEKEGGKERVGGGGRGGRDKS